MAICAYQQKPHADELPAYRVGVFNYDITDRRAGMMVMMRLLKEHGRKFINLKNMRMLWEIADLCKKNKINKAREKAEQFGWELINSGGWFIVMGNGGPEISLTAIS